MSDWRTYRHRYDDSVIYEARAKDGESYEVRNPDSGSKSWLIEVEAFEEMYELTEGEAQ